MTLSGHYCTRILSVDVHPYISLIFKIELYTEDESVKHKIKQTKLMSEKVFRIHLHVVTSGEAHT